VAACSTLGNPDGYAVRRHPYFHGFRLVSWVAGPLELSWWCRCCPRCRGRWGADGTVRRPTVLVDLSEDEREVLKRWARPPKSAQTMALRCRIVQAAGEGTGIAVELGATRPRWAVVALVRRTAHRRPARRAPSRASAGVQPTPARPDRALLPGDSVLLRRDGWSASTPPRRATGARDNVCARNDERRVLLGESGMPVRVAPSEW